MGVAVMQKDERRTGAGVFVWSGAIGNDPLIFVKCQACGICLELSKLDVDCPWDMTCRVSLGTSHIYNEG
jgi:hypothetical protein